MFWAIVHLREGETANLISLTDGSTPYVPEQDVMAFGVLSATDRGSSAGPAVARSEGTSTAQRKLKIGDSIVFIAKGHSNQNSSDIFSTIQIFYKT
jgi:hypothetical protein